MEKTSDYMLSGKTGWGMMAGDTAFSISQNKTLPRIKNIGWFVGYVEKGDDVFFFATNIESPDPVPENWTEIRVNITKQILTEIKVL